MQMTSLKSKFIAWIFVIEINEVHPVGNRQINAFEENIKSNLTQKFTDPSKGEFLRILQNSQEHLLVFAEIHRTTASRNDPGQSLIFWRKS